MEFKTRSLIIKVQLNDIVEILPNKDWTEPDTLEIAQENVAAMKQAVDGKIRGLLMTFKIKSMTKLMIGIIAFCLTAAISYAAPVTQVTVIKTSNPKLRSSII